MAAIVFPVSSAPGAHQQSGAGRIVNGYAVKTDQGARGPIRWQRSAGSRELLDITGHSHCRGMIYIGSTLIVVLDERVYAVTLSGTVFSAANLGALSGSDKVTIARNQAGTPNIVTVCDAGTFNLFTGSAPTSFADGDLPAVNSVCEANGYLAFSTGSGEIWATGLNAVTVESDAFVATQMALRRVIYFRGELLAMGPTGIKFYEETGDDPFPFRFKKITLTKGLCGTHAVAGFEEGWANQLIWAGEDNIVYRLDGYQEVPISNEAVTRAIAGAADRTLIEASVYMEGPYAIWALTSPDEWTWEYNQTTGNWHERESEGRDDARARCAVKAFDRWVVGDATTGKLASKDVVYRKEFNDPLIWQLESGDNAKFPYPITIPAAFFDFAAAVGSAAGEDPIETDPVVLLSWSLDGGYRWGNELRRSLGAQGEGGKLVRVNCATTTKAKGIRFRLRVSDPVFVGFQGGEMPDVAARAA